MSEAVGAAGGGGEGDCPAPIAGDACAMRRRTGGRALYVAAFATISWDRLLAAELLGFHLKIAYFLLAGSLALAYWDWEKAKDGGHFSLGRALRFLEPLLRVPWIFALLFAALNFALLPRSPVAKKSIGYSLWMAFNLLGFVLAGLYWFASGRDGAEARWRERLLNGWIAGAAFCSLVAIVDFAAFFAGAREGLIGSFQPHVMFFSEHGLPRPQAFSYEPSYLALAICFALPTLMIRLLKARREQWRTAAANGLALAIMAVAQVLIFSRTGLALFGIEIALVFCFFFFGASHRRKLLLAGACAVVAAGAFALIPAEQRRSIQSMFVTSLLEKRDFSANSRAAHFVGGLKLAARDWIGTGAGSAMWRWQNAYEGRLEVTHPQQATPLMSLWPEILVEQGAAGLALAAAFLATLGWRLGRNPSAEARGVFIAYAPVVVFALLLMPTFTRADLWSLIAMSGIFAAPASQAREAAVARDV